jgi:alpha-L-rhamnosidase
MPPDPPLGLRCEYLDGPLGIASPAPRFSWVPRHSRRGARPTAYQVIVSPEPSFIEDEVGDYWNSGLVESPAVSDVAYGGESLWSGKVYFWRVRWRDDAGELSPYSKPARFEMGLLHERDWKAKWIGRPTPVEYATPGTVTLGVRSEDSVQSLAVYLRREFEARAGTRRARAYVCGLGYYELRLNGRKVGDHALDPAWTDYRKIALYNVYDITELIQPRNAVAVILGNGRHLRNYGYGQPRLILQLHLELANELTERLVTDESWRVSTGAVLENGIYAGERCDFRLEPRGWDEAGFDDSAWDGAAVVPGTNLAPQLLPPIRVTERLRPVKMWSPRAGSRVFDFGQNFSGWLRVKADAPRGREIRLRHAELVHPDGTLNVLPNQDARATDVWITSGRGEEAFEPRFTYHGFRYAEVMGLPGEPSPDAVEGCFAHTDVKRTGVFTCSSPLLNKLHRNIVWGQLSNLMSIPTDCPQRDERQGWLGDAHLSAEEAILNFDMASFYTKYLEDIRLAQKEDGSLPDVVPPYLERLYPADPAWGIAYLELARLVHFYYGDTTVILKHYAGMKKYVDFLAKNAEGNLLKRLGKYGDWCPPGSIVPKKTPLALTSTWCYGRAASLLAGFARILGREDDTRRYARLADDIKAAFNAEFLLEDQYAAFRLGPADKCPNPTSNILPLAAGYVPEEKKEKVLGRLVESVVRDWDYHADTGVLGTRHLLDVLSENGRADIAYRIVTQEDYPGWGYMIKEGATTLWERWEKLSGGGMNSQNHIMFGSVDAWLYRVVAGLRCAAAGWEKMSVRPPLFAGLAGASASLETIRGRAAVAWRAGDAEFELSVTVPLGTRAEVSVPAPWEKASFREGGERVWRKSTVSGADGAGVLLSAGRPEIRFARTEAEYGVFALGSGEYRFISTRE